ncbi:ABC transporter permease [Metabacillus bambusae]|uniref:ABC transporter permease n=1 Tax=Metabacillus bambusae TaxID=2795218 RepID=A0ABS3N3T2_9BACI|nr:ABC transporter permease [Metabacillus bambusae]MBO1512907.1 ABC transporter permease [Metabacillus bambusae]
MNSIDEIWKTRVNHHINETRAYLKYMLNDHLLFVFIFLAAGGAITYQKWLETLSPNFPAILIMTIIFSLIVISSNVRTLLIEADMVFLLPMEHKLKSYFKKAFSYSLITQSFIIIVGIILFSPLYFKVANINGRVLLISIILLLIVKYWNLRISWKMGYFTDWAAKWSDLLVRFTMNVCVIFFILSQQYVFVLVLFLLMAGYDGYFSKLVKPKAIKWDQLIKKEEEKKQSFYKIANLFTDVPKLKKGAKRRKYLDWILKQVNYHQENVYEYLYLRALLRSGDYFGIIIRLTIIGSVILTFINEQLIGSSIVMVVFTFLTGIQIMSLYKHFELLELPNLYPNANKNRLRSFIKIIFRILMVQTIIYSVVNLITSTIYIFVLTVCVDVLFVSVFVLVYMKNRLNKSEKDVY